MNFFPSPGEIVSASCKDLATCFQAIYNLFFAILLALAFINFFWGAIQYLLSGASIYSKDEGKKKMINSIIALIIVFVIPVIINAINPGVFKAELKIPSVKIVGIDLLQAEEAGDYLSVSGTSDQDLINKFGQEVVDRTYEKILMPELGARIGGDGLEVSGPPKNIQELLEWDWRNVFPQGTLKKITILGNDQPGNTEFINPILKPYIIELDKKLDTPELNGIPGDVNSPEYKIKVTDGYSPGDHSSLQHIKYGTAFDVIVVSGPREFKLDPFYPKWEEIKRKIADAGFCVLDERFERGSVYSKGAHLHVYICKIKPKSK